MFPDSFENVRQLLKKLPGLGYRSAERLALHLLVEKPEMSDQLIAVLRKARDQLKRCPLTGDLSEGEQSAICRNSVRRPEIVCVVESVSDLIAFENSGVFQGWYHVLHGKLSPLQGMGPEDLFLQPLVERMDKGEVKELILALPNDIEGEATCHYLREFVVGDRDIETSRIGFGLPSGGGVTYADSATLRNALESRKSMTPPGSV